MKGGDVSLINLDDLRDDAVQEIPVMGHDEHGAVIVDQIGFQPGDGVHIQVVGGLVQKDDDPDGRAEVCLRPHGSSGRRRAW